MKDLYNHDLSVVTPNLVSSFQNWLILDLHNKNVKQTIRQTKEKTHKQTETKHLIKNQTMILTPKWKIKLQTLRFAIINMIKL
jgi:hypothetical protein